MVIKKYLKVGIIIFFIFLILVSGIIMLRKLTHNKQVFEEDLYSYIPAITTNLFQINKSKDLVLFSKYFLEIEPVLLSVSPSVTYPMLIAYANNNSSLIAKVTTEQEQSIGKILSTEVFPAFPPKTRIYKDTKIYFYPSSDNRFFVCMFYHGIFVGGYNYDFLEHVVDTDDNTNLFMDLPEKSLHKELKTNYSANLIFKEKGHVFILNGGYNRGVLEFTGYSDNASKIDTCASISDTLRIDYTIIPNEVLSYNIGLSTGEISEDFKPYFDELLYKVETDTLQKDRICLLKIKKDRFDIFKALNALEVKYIGKRLSTKDVVLRKQHVYTISDQLADSLFKEKTPVILSFYDGYLVYSKDREALVRYLKMRENKQEKTIKTIGRDVFRPKDKSLFRANNIKESKMVPFESYLSVFYQNFATVNIDESYLESGQTKTEIILNN